MGVTGDSRLLLDHRPRRRRGSAVTRDQLRYLHEVEGVMQRGHGVVRRGRGRLERWLLEDRDFRLAWTAMVKKAVAQTAWRSAQERQ